MAGYFDDDHINTLIKKQLDNDITSCGDIKYAYAIMNKKNPGDMLIINNQQSWFDIYLKGSHQFSDPVIIKSLNRVEDFSWNESKFNAAGRYSSNIFSAGRNHNIDAGHTFVLHDYKANLVVLSLFKTENNGADFELIINYNKKELQPYLIGLHQKMLNLYRESEASIKKRKNLLSVRENEILYWAGLGKTYYEVSVILGISLSTVKFHMHNIVKKLNVYNAKHAIQRATDLKLFQPDYFEHR